MIQFQAQPTDDSLTNFVTKVMTIFVLACITLFVFRIFPFDTWRAEKEESVVSIRTNHQMPSAALEMK